QPEEVLLPLRHSAAPVLMDGDAAVILLLPCLHMDLVDAVDHSLVVLIFDHLRHCRAGARKPYSAGDLPQIIFLQFSFIRLSGICPDSHAHLWSPLYSLNFRAITAMTP